MRKTLNKVIKNSGIRYFHREKQPFHGMNCHHEQKNYHFQFVFIKNGCFTKDYLVCPDSKANEL